MKIKHVVSFVFLMSSFISAYADEKDSEIKQLKSEIADLNKQLKTKDKIIDKYRDNNRKQAEDLKDKHNEIVDLKDAYNKEIVKLRELLKAENEMRRILLKAKDITITTLKYTHGKQLAELKEKYESAIPKTTNHDLTKAIDDRNNLGKELKTSKDKVKVNSLETDPNFVKDNLNGVLKTNSLVNKYEPNDEL